MIGTKIAHSIKLNTRRRMQIQRSENMKVHNDGKHKRLSKYHGATSNSCSETTRCKENNDPKLIIMS